MRGAALVRVVATVACLLVLVAALPWLRGEDPAETVLRVRFHARGRDAEAVDEVRRSLDLPSDPWSGVLSWAGNALRGDLGTSWVSEQPVVERLGPALAASLTLAGTALLLALVVTALGLVAPVRRAALTGAPTRGSLGTTGVTVAAVPEAVLGTLLVIGVAVHLHWLPATGWSGWSSVVLPALALGLPAAGLLLRLGATALDEAVAEPWVTTWRACGVPAGSTARALARRVVARGASLASVVWIGMLGSSVAVEKVFSIPGVGSLAVRSALTQDVPVLQACLLAVVALGAGGAAAGTLLHRGLLRGAQSRDDLRVAAVTPVDGARRTMRLGAAAAVLVALVVVTGLPRDGRSADLGARLSGPGAAHPLGADAVGHDLWGRVAEGTLVTVGLALLVSLAALALAVVVGLASRRLRTSAIDVLVAVPSTVVGLVVVVLTGPGLLGACLAVAAVAWLPLAVHARGLVVDARSGGHVGAAVRLGVPRLRVLRVHLLPGILGPLVLHSLARLPLTAVAIAGLSFIGLGADPDAAELGAMLAEGLRYTETAPWTVAVPGGVLLLLGVSSGAVPVRRSRG